MLISPAAEEVERNIIERFSTLNRLLHILAYCTRYAQNCRSLIATRKRGPLTSDEINSARIVAVRISQQHWFKCEISSLTTMTRIKAKSKISSLCPFLDKNDVLRIGGRLNNANLTYDKKHPIIIDNKSHLARLIILHEHLKTLHGGLQLTMSYVRNTYWIRQRPY